MGNKQTIFTDEQLDAYQDCTFFTRKEILRMTDQKGMRFPCPNFSQIDLQEEPWTPVVGGSLMCFGCMAGTMKWHQMLCPWTIQRTQMLNYLCSL
ncbi:calcium and integrin-binding family member 2-like isoform X2 [Apteryx rowi]|uniref:calcium and integrin-binding family member 2-like isoform X2 n=1 Tax=Apteryx rowi TaxID=308060 RepID=UPI000E1DCFE0|nr:calcium and integrin-binding family member 2-like isoform X2 [Apteryx rowi]